MTATNHTSHSDRKPPAPRTTIWGGAHSRGLRPAWNDIVDGFSRFHFWHSFAWNDIRARYRRSRIGEFWISLSVGIFLVSIGLVYGLLFNQPIQTYLPYLSVGYVLWLLFSTLVLDACQTFISTGAFLRQLRIPLTALALRIVERSFITFAHNLAAVLVVLVVFGVSPHWSAIFILPALLLWWLNALWLTLALGIVCARFRDVPQLVASTLQILFLITPVLWKPELAPEKLKPVAALNPVTHFLAIIRDPALGTAAPILSWLVVVAVTALGWIAALALLSRYRARIAYWA